MVKHVVLECGLRQSVRKELRDSVGNRNRWGDMPFLLGGWSEQKDPTGTCIDGEASKWKPNSGVVKATIDFAIKTWRFISEGQAGQVTTRGGTGGGDERRARDMERR